MLRKLHHHNIMNLKNWHFHPLLGGWGYLQFYSSNSAANRKLLPATNYQKWWSIFLERKIPWKSLMRTLLIWGWWALGSFEVGLLAQEGPILSSFFHIWGTGTHPHPSFMHGHMTGSPCPVTANNCPNHGRGHLVYLCSWHAHGNLSIVLSFLNPEHQKKLIFPKQGVQMMFHCFAGKFLCTGVDLCQTCPKPAINFEGKFESQIKKSTFYLPTQVYLDVKYS